MTISNQAFTMEEHLKDALGSIGTSLKYLLSLLKEIDKARGQAQVELLDIAASPRKTAEELRSSLLAPYRQALEHFQYNEKAARELKGFKRYSAVWHAKASVKEASKRLQQRIKILERDEQSNLILDISKILIRESESQAAKRKEVVQSIARYDEADRQAKSLSAKLHDIGRAIQAGRKVSTSIAEDVKKIHQRLSAGDLSGALRQANNLKCPSMPPETLYAEWQDEANDILLKATFGPVGFRSTFHHSAIAEDSVLLISRGLRDRTLAQSIAQAPANSWPSLINHITSLKHYIYEAHWPIYWALFQASQEFAVDLSRSPANEENLSGALTKGLAMQLQNWAGSRVDLLKHPQSKAVLSTMRLGGMAAEASLGADVGILVDINLGDLKVRKLVLLQAKVSRSFKANIGSDPTGPESKTQLQKLNNFVRDFYLFYNWSELENDTFLPTVASIPALFGKNSLKESDKTASYVRIDTRKCGWDLASFFTFGLCAPGSAIGQELEDTETFEEVLAGLDYPPHRLIIASFNGLEMTLDLEKRIRAEYEGTKHSKKSYGLGNEVEGAGHELDSDGYGLR
jgi:hypothetical protein